MSGRANEKHNQSSLPPGETNKPSQTDLTAAAGQPEGSASSAQAEENVASTTSPLDPSVITENQDEGRALSVGNNNLRIVPSHSNAENGSSSQHTAIGTPAETFNNALVTPQISLQLRDPRTREQIRRALGKSLFQATISPPIARILFQNPTSHLRNTDNPGGNAGTRNKSPRDIGGSSTRAEKQDIPSNPDSSESPSASLSSAARNPGVSNSEDVDRSYLPSSDATANLSSTIPTNRESPSSERQDSGAGPSSLNSLSGRPPPLDREVLKDDFSYQGLIEILEFIRKKEIRRNTFQKRGVPSNINSSSPQVTENLEENQDSLEGNNASASLATSSGHGERTSGPLSSSPEVKKEEASRSNDELKESEENYLPDAAVSTPQRAPHSHEMSSVPFLLQPPPLPPAQSLSSPQASSDMPPGPETATEESGVQRSSRKPIKRKQKKSRTPHEQCKPTDMKEKDDDDDEIDPGEDNARGSTSVLPGKARKLSPPIAGQSSKRHAGQGQKPDGAVTENILQGRLRNFVDRQQIAHEGSPKQTTKEKHRVKLTKSKTPDRPRCLKSFPQTPSVSIFESVRTASKASITLRNVNRYERANMPKDYVPQDFRRLRGSSGNSSNSGKEGTTKVDSRCLKRRKETSGVGINSTIEPGAASSKCGETSQKADQTGAANLNREAILMSGNGLKDDVSTSQSNETPSKLKKRKTGPVTSSNGDASRSHYWMKPVVSKMRQCISSELDGPIAIEAWIEHPKLPTPRKYRGQEIIRADINLIYLTFGSTRGGNTSGAGQHSNQGVLRLNDVNEAMRMESAVGFSRRGNIENSYREIHHNVYPPILRRG